MSHNATYHIVEYRYALCGVKTKTHEFLCVIFDVIQRRSAIDARTTVVDSSKRQSVDLGLRGRRRVEAISMP